MIFTALVMAASRRGATDPVAQATGVTQKSLAPVAGIPMLSRVLKALRESAAVGRVFVSIENAQMLSGVPESADAVAVPSAGTLAASVVAAVRAMPPAPWPLLITTSDNALHTPTLLDEFARASLAAGTDVTVAMTPASVTLAKYPHGLRAFHHFKDGDASGCNLYALMNDRALAAAQAFAGGGQFGKKPWRVLRAFGVGIFIRHIFRRLTMDEAIAGAGKAFGLTARVVRLDIPEAPIDVDNAADLALAEEILRARESS